MERYFQVFCLLTLIFPSFLCIATGRGIKKVLFDANSAKYENSVVNFDIYKLEDEDETHSYVIYSVTRDGKTGNLDKWSFDDKGPQHHWGVLNRSMHLISLDEVLCEAQLSDRTLKFVNRDELVRCSKNKMIAISGLSGVFLNKLDSEYLRAKSAEKTCKVQITELYLREIPTRTYRDDVKTAI